MPRRYRFYVNGGISERLLATIRGEFPTLYGSSSAFPFFPKFNIDPNDPDFLIDKISEPIINFTLTLEESYFDVIFADRPAGIVEFDDDTWFNTLVESVEEQIVNYSIVSEQLDNEE